MTLSSLLNDGPALMISFSAPAHDESHERSNSFAWSDFPLIGDFTAPLERNELMMEKQPELLALSVSSSEASLCDEEEKQPPAPIKRRKGHKKSVSFNRFLEIREHALTIGDHPLCKDALPLSLAWEHGETEMLELNEYEEGRSGYRRSGNQMKLTYFERKNMLRRIAGMSEADMRRHQKMHQSLPSTANLSCFAGLSTSR